MSFASDASTPVARAGFAVVAGVSLAAVLWWLVGQVRPQLQPPDQRLVGQAGEPRAEGQRRWGHC